MSEDSMSVISEIPGTTSVFSGKITHAERNLSRMEQNKTKEVENLRALTAKQDDELTALKSKFSALKARSDVLEKQNKDMKSNFTNKMKVLIDKTENDDKLINMLKAEIKKLEGSKGVTSSLTSGMSKSAMTKAMANTDHTEEFMKMQARINMLNNNIKCLEMDLEHKEEKI